MSSAAPELTAPEKAMLAEKHAKKLAETLKRGISVMLRDIMQHKVDHTSVLIELLCISLAFACRPAGVMPD